jgi:hypothetical protein
MTTSTSTLNIHIITKSLENPAGLPSGHLLASERQPPKQFTVLTQITILRSVGKQCTSAGTPRAFER